MIYIFIAVISILALAVDFYIYKRIISRHNFGHWWKIGYIVYAVLIDTAIITALLLYREVSENDSDKMMKAVIWTFGIFFLNTIPKMTYAIVSLGDYIVQLFRKKTSHIFGYTGTALAFVVFVTMVFGMTAGRSAFRTTTVDLYFDNLPESFDGTRVVQFSDTHIGNLVHRNRFLERMVDLVNSLEPDIIINSGDLVNIHAWELEPDVMSILVRLQAKHGIYSSLGNHDLGIYIQNIDKYSPEESLAELIRRQESLGWEMLVNRSVWLSNGLDSITVSAVGFPMGHRHNGREGEIVGVDLRSTYDSIVSSSFNLTISHTPQIWDELLEYYGPDLTLAGHVHAMQLKFTMGRFSWSPAKFMYDRWSGLYKDSGKYLYVNDGAGYVMYPMRIGTRPEITVFNLHTKRDRR